MGPIAISSFSKAKKVRSVFGEVIELQCANPEALANFTEILASIEGKIIKYATVVLLMTIFSLVIEFIPGFLYGCKYGPRGTPEKRSAASLNSWKPN